MDGGQRGMAEGLDRGNAPFCERLATSSLPGCYLHTGIQEAVRVCRGLHLPLKALSEPPLGQNTHEPSPGPGHKPLCGVVWEMQSEEALRSARALPEWILASARSSSAGGVSSRVSVPASLECLESTADHTQRVNLCAPAGSTQVSVQVFVGRCLHSHLRAPFLLAWVSFAGLNVARDL